MRRRVKPIAVAWLLGLLLSINACALWQSDPVGASLLSMGVTKDAAVKSAGNAYINGVITFEQLQKFVVEARKVNSSYNSLVTLHAVRSLPPGDERIAAVDQALRGLEKLIVDMVQQKASKS